MTLSKTICDKVQSIEDAAGADLRNHQRRIQFHPCNTRQSNKMDTKINAAQEYHPAMKHLYDAGKDDREIAAELGVTRTAVWTWRQENHLQPQSVRRKKAPLQSHPKLPKAPVDEDAAMAAYLAGKTDFEIAKAIGCDLAAVADWRRRVGLNPNRAKRVAKGQAYELQAAAVEAKARESGLTYGQYQALRFEAAQNPHHVPDLGTERS